MRIYTRFNMEAMEAFRGSISRLGEEGPAIMSAMLNEGGLALRMATVAAETRQIGLPEATVDRAQKAIASSPSMLRFTTMVEGGNVRLKYFGAKEGGGGVTASPWGKSTFYPGAWITSGPQGNRRPSPKLNGQVFNASGSRKWWQKFTGPVRSGAYLPDELVKGDTVEVFESRAPILLEGIFTRITAAI